jgi:hypothetical protein
MIFCCLKAMLYPDTQIGIVAQAYRQVRSFIFPEYYKWYHRMPYFRNTVSNGRQGISIANERCIINFKNGSFIEGLPPGHDGGTIRGRRYHVLCADEYAQIDETIIKEVMRPMLNVKVHDRDNQYHWFTTPYHKWNHFWPTYLHQVEMCIKEPHLYGLVEFDYRDVNETPLSKRLPRLPYSIDMKMMEKQKSDQPYEKFAMENLARFPEESNSFFPSKLIDSCARRKAPMAELQFEGKEGGIYAMGVDVARTQDNFSISIIHFENQRKNLVRVQTLKQVTHQEMCSLIRKYLVKFPIELLGIGQGGGGMAIKDLLAVPWVDDETGNSYPRILDQDDDGHKFLQGSRIIKMVKESNQLNDYMYSTLKSDMEHQRFLMPSPSFYAEVDMDTQEAKAVKEIKELQNEMLKLQVVETSHGRKFEVPNRHKDTKDRVTSTVIANYLLSEQYKETTYKDFLVKPMGYWVTPKFNSGGWDY